MNDRIRLFEIPGPEVEPWLDALGRLRITVFREFPYLYDGTPGYEREYLAVYRNCAESLVVLALDEDGQAVGATTCMPLAAEAAEFREPFGRAGIDPGGILYLGESVVLRDHRGGGLGGEFFARRENHARRLGLKSAAFCAVDRPDDHPLRPAEYRPPDGFWTRMGYAKRPELRATFSWKEIGEDAETPKSLTFWSKSWND
jgi:GNAT superfamily N-acetyltransferase